MIINYYTYIYIHINRIYTRIYTVDENKNTCIYYIHEVFFNFYAHGTKRS